MYRKEYNEGSSRWKGVKGVDETPDQIYTIPQVAGLLGVHKDTVQTWIEEGKLGSVKIGYRTVRILQSDIDEFIRSRHIKPDYVPRAR